MKSKIKKKYIYQGFGFDVELNEVELIFINNEWMPKIDVKKAANLVMAQIPFQHERLNGFQVKFIRDYFGMSLRDFARDVVKVSHMAVSKWEKFKTKPTNMDINIECLLRLYILEKTEKFNEKKFYSMYREIRQREYTFSEPRIVLKEVA